MPDDSTTRAMELQAPPEPSYSGDASFTLQGYGDESASAARFEHMIADSGLFKVYREVSGHDLQPRIGCPYKSPRIDRILIPNHKLLDAGWAGGIIGVELEASGLRIGPILAQLDYHHSVYTLPNGFDVCLRWIFIWPWDGGAHTPASISAQQRIGGARGDYGRLEFCAPNWTAISWSKDGLTVKPFRSGNKAGSR